MAQSSRFDLSIRVLGFLALAPESHHTSAVIAAALGSSPVMVRRVFAGLHQAGFLEQRKGPSGGAKLKTSARQIGLGDVFQASEPGWLVAGGDALAPVLRKVRRAAIEAMNETSIANVVKKRKKG